MKKLDLSKPVIVAYVGKWVAGCYLGIIGNKTHPYAFSYRTDSGYDVVLNVNEYGEMESKTLRVKNIS